jgi:hypothetical protein
MPIAPGAPSLNTTLQGLADVAGAAVRTLYPDVAVFPYARVIAPTQTFPVLCACPFAGIVEETYANLRGNRPTHQQGKGNNIYTLVYLQAPAISNVADDGAAQIAMHDAVDCVLSAFPARKRSLPDEGGNARAKDAGSVIIAHFPQGGPPINYRGDFYIGCLITIEVWEHDRP